MPLSVLEIIDVQGDLGITSDQSVFTDAQLQRFYDRAGSKYAGALVFAYRTLLANAVKLRSYTAGNTSERAEQIYDHLRLQLTDWESRAGMSSAIITVGSLSYGIDYLDPSDIS